MNINELQQRVDDWIRTYGVRYFDVTTNTLLLMEETGELARHIARVYGEQSYKAEKDSKESLSAIKEELGDIFFVLLCLANQLGVSLQDIIEDSIRKKTLRDSDRHSNNDKLKS